MKTKILIPIILLTSMLLVLILTATFAEGYNYEYVNVTSMVNITNAKPEILNMTINDPIILNAGTTKLVTCNATIFDWNGYNDIQNVNATFFHQINSVEGEDHTNNHYTNESCAEVSNDGEYVANYSCSFDVLYYADSENWTCDLTVISSANLTDNDHINTTVDELYALNVTSVIDYGNLTVTETSDDVVANVTNFGNTGINVSVLGYGETEGDGLGLVCEFGDDIGVENQRFSNTTMVWDDKTPLEAIAQDMQFTLPQPTQETFPVITSTYWQLYVPPNPFGLCTGTVRFTATTP